jgi:hypothetical protein
VNRSITAVVVAVASVRQKGQVHKRNTLQHSVVVSNALALRVTRNALLQIKVFVIIYIYSFKV